MTLTHIDTINRIGFNIPFPYHDCLILWRRCKCSDFVVHWNPWNGFDWSCVTWNCQQMLSANKPHVYCIIVTSRQNPDQFKEIRRNNWKELNKVDILSKLNLNLMYKPFAMCFDCRYPIVMQQAILWFWHWKPFNILDFDDIFKWNGSLL